jgi:type I restriction enzyme S subunit
MNGESNLPEGWISVSLPEICEINPKKPQRDTIPPDTPVTFVPMPAVNADLGAIKNPEIRKFVDVRSGFTFFRDEDVIFAKITPCMENGKAAIARNLISGMGFGSTEFFTLRSKGSVIPEYLYHYIRQESFRKDAEENMTGSVGQKRVPKQFIENTIIPLPPLAEQRRIVAALDALLARVNASRERFDRVPDILKAFRQTILAAACSGSLTEGWREEHPNLEITFLKKILVEIPDDWIIPKEWQLTTINYVCEKIVDCPHTTPKWTPLGRICIRTSEIKPYNLDLSQTRFVSDETYRERIQRLEPKECDIVFSREGTLGQAAIIPKGVKICLGQRIMLLRSESHCSPLFLMYLLNSPQILKIVNDLTTGSTSPHINVGDVKNFPVPLPPMLEQHEIVRRVESLFALVDRIDQRVAAGKERADRLIQAILTKAFRGELVLTEAELARREGQSYEPASAMLERIQKEGEKEGKKKKQSPPKLAVQEPS